MTSIPGTFARRVAGLVYLVALGAAAIIATAETGRLTALGVPVLILAAATLRYPGHSSLGTAAAGLIIAAYAIGAAGSQGTDFSGALAVGASLIAAHLAQWLLQLISGASAVTSRIWEVALRRALLMALSAIVVAMLAFVASATPLANSGGFATALVVLVVLVTCAYIILPRGGLHSNEEVRSGVRTQDR